MGTNSPLISEKMVIFKGVQHISAINPLVNPTKNMTPGKPIRVAVASDLDVYRRGLTSLIMSIPGIQLVGEARDEAESLQLCKLVQPDLILLDFKSAIEVVEQVARTIHEHWPQIRIVLMVDSYPENPEESARGSGLSYYFQKDISEEEFSAATIHLAEEIQVERSQAGRVGESAETVVKREYRNREIPSIPIPARSPNEEYATRELVMAGRIQSDILPEKPPALAGWDISAKLEPAHETSGDFYDFIPMANGNWGFVVADVTDKGMGAALFMALTSTLIRTYAVRYPTLPALAMDVVNDRILSDTRGSMFVTTFYGVLEPTLGRLRYVNAGHPPACLVSTHRSKPIDRLGPTGRALGLIENIHWQQKICRLNPGDVLVIYTDGITEAQSPRGEFFGQGRLMDIIRSQSSESAYGIQEAVLSAVHTFVADTPRQDDIAIIVICRKS